MSELRPGRRGRPRIYRDIQEGRRARASRPDDSQITGERFPHTFLYYDPRIIPGESTWHAESRSQFEEIEDALNAVPLSHESGGIDTLSPDDSNISLSPQQGSLLSNNSPRPSAELRQSPGQPPSDSIIDPVPVGDSHSLPSEAHRSESPAQLSPDPHPERIINDWPSYPSTAPEPVDRLRFATAQPPEQHRPPRPLAAALVDQLLRHHGCEEHTALSASPSPSQRGQASVSLSTLASWSCPDLLAAPYNQQISQYPTNWNTLLPPMERRRLFTGLPHDDEPPVGPRPVPPPTVDLEADTISPEGRLQVLLDIDSAGGLASSLAVAREGISWKAQRAQVSNLQSSLHLAPIRVQWIETASSCPRRRLQPIHRTPHLPFGRLDGYPAVEVYLLFPRLFHPSLDHFVITKDDWRIWTDEIFLPSVHAVYRSSITQHLPSSAEHIERNAQAPQIETGVQTHTRSGRAQDFHYSLQSDGLDALWVEIQRRVNLSGHAHFLDCQIILTAKNLKLQTQQSTWAATQQLFFTRWNRAVNPNYLHHDFYDIAKEVISHQRAPQPLESVDPALILSWRRCCLYTLSQWLARNEVSFEQPIEASTASSLDSPQRDRASTPAEILSEEEEEDGEDGEVDEEEQVETQASSSVQPETDRASSLPPTEAGAQASPHWPQPPKGWRVQFYPQCFLRDQGSLTIEPSRKSTLWQQGLRYCQMYNTSKDIFAAGNHYLFGNEKLDTLALDPGMVRSWQHAGGAVSHSPLAVLRAYLHTKQRCHIALVGCRSRSYGTREEYRVSGALLVAMDALIRERGLASWPIEPSTSPMPFFTHPTPLVLDWWRWNINKLCVGFEMTYSLRPRTFVHWEHTRVMMMFLQCLMRAYGGQGQHLRRSLGLWIDRRTQTPPEGSDQEIVQEGMAMGVHLQCSGYAWMADKIDWEVMVFSPNHRPSMVFNTPSLQSAYITRYRDVVQAKGDFLFFHDLFSLLHQHRMHQSRSAFLLQVLLDACLRAFRQDIFRALSTLKHQQPLHPGRLREATAGHVPLTAAGFQSVFEHGHLLDDLHFINPQRASVSHIETLFIFLWGWDGDGNQGDWDRRGWEFRAYRVLYRQCYGVIAQIHGVLQAREWRLRLKETWMRTHHILPYPNARTFWSREAGRLQTWASRHLLVEQYYELQRRPLIISPLDVDQLPVWGWVASSVPSLFEVTLSPVPLDVAAALAVVNDQDNILSPPRGPILPAAGMVEGPISAYLREHAPEQRVLRSFTRQHGIQTDRLHRNHHWLQTHLTNHITAVATAHRREVDQLSRPEYRSWQRRRRPRLDEGLRQFGLRVEQLEEEDSDPENLRSQRDKLNRRLGRMQVRLRATQRHVNTLQDLSRKKDRYRRLAASGRFTQAEWDGEYGEQFRALRRDREIVLSRLERVSRQSTRPWL